ncbi:hypothetical protein E2C01_059537 [Portunus trituberculatus]|uniref:Uncharacterized protein n=1 Tax=Portunus trituberculatus TaxID=210409 RepID=A0A5B7H5L8_PORTR|nr:hypothetical protein [Portunus trituberculatus]
MDLEVLIIPQVSRGTEPPVRRKKEEWDTYPRRETLVARGRVVVTDFRAGLPSRTLPDPPWPTRPYNNCCKSHLRSCCSVDVPCCCSNKGFHYRLRRYAAQERLFASALYTLLRLSIDWLVALQRHSAKRRAIGALSPRLVTSDAVRSGEQCSTRSKY